MFCQQALDAWRERIDNAMESDSESILRSRGEVFGARNLLSLIPEIVLALQAPELKSFCDSILGSEWGVVRGLYFDKPLEASWSLPWHQDMTIAVESNQLSSGHFCNPTQKAGVDHVEAPNWLLEKMLTIRIHLDPMTRTNGPMLVQPGSHRNGKYSKQALSLEAPVTLQCNAGDVLAMRPLLSHSSIMSLQGNQLRRRVVHLELSSCRELPDGYKWQRYQSITNLQTFRLTTESES